MYYANGIYITLFAKHVHINPHTQDKTEIEWAIHSINSHKVVEGLTSEAVVGWNDVCCMLA